jgi:small subunit ribosomal protein S6
MQGVFEKCGARLIKIENWGNRLLAYPIKRSANGIYLYWRYLGGSDIVHEFERNLRLTDSVLRFYTVLVDEDVDPAARPSEITDDLLENISEPPPEPEPEPAREVEEENSMYADDGVEGLEEGVS